MTSIEALDNILSCSVSLGYDTDYDPPRYCGDVCVGTIYLEEEKIIREDLEKLEKLKEIIKENFDYNSNGVFLKYNLPVMEDEIKEVLENDKH